MKKQYRFISLLLALALLTTSLPAFSLTAQAATEYSDDDYTYTVENGEAIITGYTGPGGDITIPSSLDGYAVSTIEELAFYDCTTLTSVTISEGVRFVEMYAFQDCTRLTSVNIPASVTRLDVAAFYGCTAITGFWVDENSADYFSDQYGVLYNGYKTTLIKAPTAMVGSYTIPSGTKWIGDSAFHNCENLTDIKFADSVEWIESQAFDNCVSLTSVVIPDSVTFIGGYAFNGCKNLSSVALGSGIKRIMWGAFSACSSLISVNIPKSVTSIDDYPFCECSNLTGIWVESDNEYYMSDSRGVLYDKAQTVLIQAPGGISGSYVIPSSVTEIDSSAFDGCAKLTELTIPSGAEIRTGVFDGCDGLKTLHLPQDIGSDVLNTYYDVFETVTEIYYSGTQQQWLALLSSAGGPGSLAFPNTTVYLTDGVITPEVESNIVDSGTIGTNLTWELDREGTLTIIGTGLMDTIDRPRNWDEVKKIIIGEGITTISYGAFGHMQWLEEVSLPSTVEKIDDYAFDACYALNSINFPEGLAYIGMSAFQNTALTDINIPSTVEEISDSAFTLCQDLITVNISGDTHISAEAFMWCENLTTVYLGDGATHIGANAFDGCTSLQSITIPGSVECISMNAFSDCTALSEIKINEGVKTVEGFAFENCAGLKEITIPNSVTFIGSGVFFGCSSLSNVSVPYLGSEREDATGPFPLPLGFLFDGYGYLSFEGSVETKQYNTSMYTEHIEVSYYLPAGLTSVTISDGDLPFNAFRNCCSLKYVYLSDKITRIPDYTFDNCSGLTDVYFDGTRGQWNALTIGAHNEALDHATIHFKEETIPNGWYLLDGKWYYGQNGRNVLGWQYIARTWYYFKASGVMQTGWQRIAGKWYYFNASGAMATGWLQEGKTWYYLDSSGAMVTGEYTIGGKLHKFNSSGVWLGEVQKNGWVMESGKWYFYQNGTKKTGWLYQGGVWYYMDASGAMSTGWKQIGGTWYYFNASGAMATGWVQVSGTWYYMNSSGAMVTGWLYQGGKWYYLNSSGAMQTGWKQIGGTWYYFESSGVMATGWKNMNQNGNGAWAQAYLQHIEEKYGEMYFYTLCYIDDDEIPELWIEDELSGAGRLISYKNGELLDTMDLRIGGDMMSYIPYSGLLYVSSFAGNEVVSDVAYKLENGSAVRMGYGTIVTDGQKIVELTWNGEAVSESEYSAILDQYGTNYIGYETKYSYQEIQEQMGSTWYYFNASGAMQTGWLKQGNVWYYFHASGEMATGSVLIGNKTYNFDSSGACLNP